MESFRHLRHIHKAFLLLSQLRPRDDFSPRQPTGEREAREGGWIDFLLHFLRPELCRRADSSIRRPKRRVRPPHHQPRCAFLNHNDADDDGRQRGRKNNSEVFQLCHRGVCLSDAPRRYPLGRLSSPRPGWTGWVCRETGRARQPTMRKGKRSDHDRGQVIAVRRAAFSEKGENDRL